MCNKHVHAAILGVGYMSTVTVKLCALVMPRGKFGRAGNLLESKTAEQTVNSRTHQSQYYDQSVNAG